MLSSRSWCPALACFALSALGPAQTAGSKATVRYQRIADSSSRVSAEVIEAEKALDQQDYARAKKLLLAATAASPQDARAWFDLGLAERGAKEMPAAIEPLRNHWKSKMIMPPPSNDMSRLLPFSPIPAKLCAVW